MNHKVIALLASLALINSASAATAIDLRNQPLTTIQKYMALPHGATSNQAALKTTRKEVDFNNTTHAHLQQTYQGHVVWGASAVVHTPAASTRATSLTGMPNNTTMNGIIYENLDKDLLNTPAYALSDAQKAKALQQAKLNYEKKTGKLLQKVRKESSELIVFVDDENQAHYAYLTSFYIDDGKTGAHKPTSIIDAVSLQAYRTWDNVMTMTAGGIGGNQKTGPIVYDGDKGHLPGLEVSDQGGYCSLTTEMIRVHDVSYDEDVVTNCELSLGKHNNVYWMSLDKNESRWSYDEANGGYSPSIDAFYAAEVIQGLYKNWYNIPALVKEDGKTPMQLVMRVHYGRGYDNAFWDGEQMTFGDGGDLFYPLTSVDVAAHEISHGFTSQHSNLDYSLQQSAALHESFSDMASAAMEYYSSNKNTWELGRSIFKGNRALRYMDNPKKDGQSIDNIKNLTNAIDPHNAAGITNKAFYLIATSPNWNTRMAFDIMVNANMHYWTSSTKTFKEAACGVISATKDYHYNVTDVQAAFSKVGLDTSKC